MNVLLLDDEPLELEQLEYLIGKQFPNWQIYAAESLKKALALLEEVRFQLAFIDIKLRGSSGLDLARDIRKKKESMDIVIVSAYQDFHYAKESIHLGVMEYLVKPVLEDELKKLLVRYTENHPEFFAKTDLIQKVLNHIHEHFPEKLNLSDLAQEFHINASYLSRRFSEEVGMSFSDYLIQYRIQMAKHFMLAKRDWSISRVSAEAGFNTSHYFSKMFKKITNLTPKEFRRSYGSKVN